MDGLVPKLSVRFGDSDLHLTALAQPVALLLSILRRHRVREQPRLFAILVDEAMQRLI